MYISIYKVCVFRQHFFIEVYLIKYHRHPFSTYFDFDAFK